MWLFLLLSSFLSVVLRYSVEGNSTPSCCLSNFVDDDNSKGKLIYCLGEDNTCWSTYTRNALLVTGLPVCIDPDTPYCRRHSKCVCCTDENGSVVCYNKVTKHGIIQTSLSIAEDDQNQSSEVVNHADDSTESLGNAQAEVPIRIPESTTVTPNLRSSILEVVAINATDLPDITQKSLNYTVIPSSEEANNVTSFSNTLNFTVTSTTTDGKNQSTTTTSKATLPPERISSTSENVHTSTNSPEAAEKSSNHTVKPSRQDNNSRTNYNYFYILFVIPVIVSVGVAYYILKYKKRIGEDNFSVVQRQNTRRKPDVRPSWVFSEPETSDNDDSGEEEEGHSLHY